MGKGQQFKRLFEPTRIGQMELRNHIVMAPMGTNFAAPDGSVSERIKDYYEERARGGVGLVIVEATSVDYPEGKVLPNQLSAHDDSLIPGLSELVAVIHKHGAKAALQLQHGGRETHSAISHLQPVAPSPIPMKGGEMPRELTVEEIEDITARFIKAAERAKKAGFDCVEIHGAHGYLIAQFLSRASNQRHDIYGGSLPNRARLLLDIIRGIKASLGKGYPVLCRINGREYGIENGITIDESRELAPMIQEAGADAIHVSANGMGIDALEAPIVHYPGNLVPLAESIKKVVTIPVITVGKISPELGERILEEQKADLIAMGRALIADPELPNKVSLGRRDKVMPCTSCTLCIDGLMMKGIEVKCAVNPAAGREEEYRICPAEKAKRVLIIGGGPAGTEAARVAALRGHRVMLYERDSRLGGQLIPASLPPNKDDLANLIDSLSVQIGELGVEVELGEEVDPALVERIHPDVVILATGVVPLIPEIDGTSRGSEVTAEDVLNGKVEVGHKAVIIGGGMVGCELADFLTEKGKAVAIVEMQKRLASGMPFFTRRLLLHRLSEKKVEIFTSARVVRMAEKGLVVIDAQGEEQIIEADTVIFATGSQPNTELYNAIKGKIAEVYLVGDCVQPRRISEAMDDGFRIGMKV